TPRELRHAMRDRRAELKRSLKKQRLAAQEKLESMPAVQRARARRRRRRFLLFIILLLLAAVMRCGCQPAAPAPPPPGAAAAPEVASNDAGVRPLARRPLEAKVKPQHRGAYGVETPPPPPWLDAFLLQVSARSPRIAECFTGSDRPGVLR